MLERSKPKRHLSDLLALPAHAANAPTIEVTTMAGADADLGNQTAGHAQHRPHAPWAATVAPYQALNPMARGFADCLLRVEGLSLRDTTWKGIGSSSLTPEAAQIIASEFRDFLRRLGAGQARSEAQDYLAIDPYVLGWHLYLESHCGGTGFDRVVLDTATRARMASAARALSEITVTIIGAEVHLLRTSTPSL